MFCATLLVSCEEKHAKVYSCSEYSIECELQKDNILVKPVNFEKNLMDVYGNAVDSGNYYVNNIHSNGLAPVERQTRGDDFNGSGYYVEYTNTKYFPDTKSDTVNLSLRVHGLSKAIIILTGLGEFKGGSGIEGQAYLLSR